MALLASQGMHDVAVIHRLRVLVLSNGAELAADAPGACQDSNVPILGSLGVRVTICATPTDNVARQADCLRVVRCGANVVVTTGGISVGARTTC